MSRTPLVIYVLWHPAAPDGARLASEIYRWFHVSSDDLLRSGMGVPVFFRSAPHAPGARTPRAIELDEADLNVLVVLAEENMVADAAWAAYLEAFDREENRPCIVPVALHPSAYRLPEMMRRLNFLRVDERDDPPVDSQAQLSRRIPRLLRQLTEFIGRQLAARLTPDPAIATGRAPPALTIFLSHAKRDGVEVAEALRSVIQDNGRVRAFFDDSDLPVGHAFASELEEAALRGSAAMIAVVSDAYAGRPWCRREIELARRPRPDPDAAGCWWIQPVLVVDALRSAPTRCIPELGNAMLVRWAGEGALATVDLLMLEVLLGCYHRLRARHLPAAPGRHVISWTPDLPTLVELKRAAGGSVREVVYPGHALPQAEASSLRRVLPDVELRAFEQVERPADAPVDAIGDRVIGLSTAFSDDLGSLGLGREHLEEITLRIARCVVEIGGRVAFGGMLKSSGLTETLLTLVRSLSSDDVETCVSREPRILSYQRWPSLPTAEQIAADVGICEYVLIDTPLPVEQRLTYDPRVASPARARELVHTLSAMRSAMAQGGRLTTANRPAPPLDARIVVGGVRHGFNGAMPGVLEEVLYSLERRQPVYVVGGFGGAASVLAKAMLGQDVGRELTPAHHRAGSERFRMLETGLAQCGEGQHIEVLFKRLKAAINGVCGDLSRGLDNGLDLEQNQRLMKSDHVGEIVQLLKLGLVRRFAQAA